MAKSSQQSSDSTSTLVTILLLIFVAPAGLIVMWFWPKWPTWVKILVSLLVIIPLIIVLMFGGLFISAVLTGMGSLTSDHRQACQQACQNTPTIQTCTQRCNRDIQVTPMPATPYTADLLLKATRDLRSSKGLARISSTPSQCAFAQKVLQESILTKTNVTDIMDKYSSNGVTRQSFPSSENIFHNFVEVPTYSTNPLPLEFRQPNLNFLKPELTTGCFAIQPSSTTNMSLILFIGGN